MRPRHLPEHVPARFSWKAVHAGHVRAQRRLAALRRACALGGVSLAVLAGSAPSAAAQDAAPVRKPLAAASAPGVATPWTPDAQSFVATFAAPVANPFGIVAAGPSTTYVTPTLADLDGDGDMDLLRGANAGEFVYYQNTAGAGNTPIFATGAVSPFGLTDIGAFSAPSVADADGDGDLDLFAGNTAGQLIYAQNTAGPNATPAFAAPVTNPFGFVAGGGYTAPAADDIDGDGDVDVLLGRSAGDFRYLQNTAGRGATPAFAAAVVLPFGLTATGSYSQPTLADLDRDGDLDVLAINGYAPGSFFYFQNTAGPGATPAFAAAVTNPFGLATLGTTATQPGVGDVDGDGDLDVFASVGANTSALQFFENTEAGASFAQTLTGTQGWRMLTTPDNTQTLAGLLAPLATQGIPGGDTAAGQPNVYRYDETLAGGLSAGYLAPATLAAAVPSGAGYFVYVFTDDDPVTPGTQGTFPKTISAPGAEAASPFTVGGLTFTNTADPDTEDGWNLRGNPFARWFDWDATARTNLDGSVYVYDPATAAYRSWNGTAGSLTGGIVGPFQGFWVKANAAAPALRLTAATGASGGPFYGRTGTAPAVVGLQLRRADGSAMRSEAFVTLGQDGAADGLDASDAFALRSPDADHLLLATTALSPDCMPVALAINARPALEGTLAVPVQVSAMAAGLPAGGDMLLTWPSLRDIPADWTVSLRDNATGAVVDLRTATEYAFMLAAERGTAAAANPLVLSALRAEAADARFTLVVGRGAVATEPAAPASFALSAPRPNPTAGGAALDLDLATAADVSVGVYDALGRRVATLAEGAQPAGRLALRLADGSLAAGVYVVRAEVRGAAVLTQRLVVTR